MQLPLPLSRVAPDFGGTQHVRPSADATEVRLEANTYERGHTIDLVFVRHPRARRYVIRVAEDGHVRVTVPRWGSKRGAARFAASQRTWIDKERRRVQEARLNARPETRAIDVELHARATRELPIRLLALAAHYDLTVTRVSIRNQKWSWGSCSPNGHICLNWRLVQMPDAIRDYVMVHELMHLKRLDHSPRFWQLVAAACPDYRAARAWLRTYRRA